jgi:DNA-binding NarL/FixJ family response regulator|tara:strand:- start:7314 stop:7598 length:285 start_codon:yes stop_codon:yes gene_type:complete
LLLRIGTLERIALGSVLETKPTQSAEAALKTLREFPADVLVADTSTTDFETMALLQGLSVICLLAESSPERVRGMIKAGVDHVMIKPISAAAVS